MLNIIYWAAVQRGIFTKFTDILSASAVERRADQGNGNENRKLQVYVPHDDDAGEQSTRVDFNASNQKFLCDLGNALSSYHKEDFGELGCGLGYLASVIKDHYNDEAQRHKKLPVRLIGDQAIALANFSFRLIDALKVLDESPAHKLERLALGKIAQPLRNAGALYNKIEVSPSYLGKLTEFCTLYFNFIYAIFFFIRC